MQTVANLKESILESIESSKALPFAAYTDEALFKEEQEKIFHHSWVPVCMATNLPNPGDYLSRNIGGEPIVIIRGKDGELRALSNVCRHRGTPLTDPGSGQLKGRLTCPYHAWAYTDKGQLMGVPYPGKTEIDKKAHCLPNFRLEYWANIAFVNLDNDAPALSEVMAGSERYLDNYAPDHFVDAAPMPEPEVWNANWKLIMENAMESYHLFKAHEQTLETITPTKGAFLLEGKPDWTITAGRYTDQVIRPASDEFPDSVREFERSHYTLTSIPPSHVGIIGVDGWGYLAVEPLSATQTLVYACFAAPEGVTRSEEQMNFTAAFFQEDLELCERAQRGMTARHTSGGQFVELEQIVTDFHRYVANKLWGTEKPAGWVAPEADEHHPKAG